MALIDNYFDLIGNTPLYNLKNIKKELNLKADILAKLEFFNPAGSIKDRTALGMIKQAVKEGKIKKDSTIIEPTSGNTGIGLAAIAANMGYKVILTMPETMSIERRKLLSAYGAQIVLTQGSKGMQGAIDKAFELSEKIPDSFIPSQFENPANPKIHYETTAREIWEDTKGKIDIFLATAGTGGTLSGCGEFFKEKNKNIKVIALEPFSSPFLSKGVSGIHKIQGIGAGFIPKTLNTKIYDEIITIKDDEAYEYTRLLAKKEGILAGISSGAALCGALYEAKKEENKNKTIVTIFPDTGERYLSSGVFLD